MKQDVLPVILGATSGAYALSHAFFHDYGIVPLVLDEEIPPLFSHTFCAYADEIKNLQRPHILYRVLEDIASKAQGKSLILIPANAHFLSLVEENAEVLERSFLMPHLPTLAENAPPADTVALTLLYRAKSGKCRTVFARVLAKAPSGEITALEAANIPKELNEKIEREAQSLRRGISLFVIDREGRLHRDTAVLPHLLAFSAAKDASFPEWMIAETVLCTPLPETQPSLSGAFTLFPYRKTKRFLSRAQRKGLRGVQKCALYTFKVEGVRRDIARVFNALYLAHIAENKPKD